MKNTKEKNKELRKQIADVLRYLRRGYYKDVPWACAREAKEVPMDTYNFSGYAPEELIEGIQEVINKASSKGIKSTNIKCYANCEYDDEYGYTTSEIVFNAVVKQSDEEYFETLCGYLLPSTYQLNQYKEYVRLKKVFEGCNND